MSGRPIKRTLRPPAPTGVMERPRQAGGSCSQTPLYVKTLLQAAWMIS